ncbi:MAG: phosphopantetheine-binding protein, partial [Candidatus Binatia bacterium]
GSAMQGEFQQGSWETLFPVGRPVEDTELFLVDEKGGVVSEGEDGEIAVRSRYLSPGYWNDTALTRKHFLPDPTGGAWSIFRTGDLGRILSDGQVIHLGRKDDQVKVRGFRISLAEIEHALRSMEGVAAAAVRFTDGREGKARIVAYVQREESYKLSTKDLRERLATVLPTYMIPSMFIYLDRLPVSANGKLDRGALPSPDCSRPELDVPLMEPRTPTENILCRLCSEVLAIEPIGVLDNLFELGGDSLTIFRLIARIDSTLGVSIGPRTFFETPIIGELASVLDKRT